MIKTYLIEFGGKKELNEMDALELSPTIDSAIDWIQGNMKSDSEYYNCHINCTIYANYNANSNNLTTQHCDALVYIDADSIVTEEMFESDIYSIDTIIESNLSVVSRIIAKGKLKEVSE